MSTEKLFLRELSPSENFEGRANSKDEFIGARGYKNSSNDGGGGGKQQHIKMEMSDMLENSFDFMNRFNPTSTPNVGNKFIDYDEIHRYLLQTTLGNECDSSSNSRVMKSKSNSSATSRSITQESDDNQNMSSLNFFDSPGFHFNMNMNNKLANLCEFENNGSKSLDGLNSGSRSLKLKNDKSGGGNGGNSNSYTTTADRFTTTQQQWGFPKGFLETASQDGFNYANPQSIHNMDFIINNQQAIAQLIQLQAPIGKVGIPRCKSNSSGAMKARSKVKNLPCKVPGCNRFYSSIKSLRNHVRIKHTNKDKNNNESGGSSERAKDSSGSVGSKARHNNNKLSSVSATNLTTTSSSSIKKRNPTHRRSKSISCNNSSIGGDQKPSLSSLISASEPLFIREQSMPSGLDRKALMNNKRDPCNSNCDSIVNIKKELTTSHSESSRPSKNKSSGSSNNNTNNSSSDLGLLDNGFLFSPSNTSFFNNVNLIDSNSCDDEYNLNFEFSDSDIVCNTNNSSAINFDSNILSLIGRNQEESSSNNPEIALDSAMTGWHKDNCIPNSSTPKAGNLGNMGRSNSFSGGM